MRRHFVGLVIAGLVVAVALATFASPFASSSPDGLERVAADNALDTEVEDHALADGPLADYGVDGVDDDRVGTGLAGLIGVAVTFAVGVGLFAAIKRLRTTTDPPPDSSPDSVPGSAVGPRQEPSSAASGP